MPSSSGHQPAIAEVVRHSARTTERLGSGFAIAPRMVVSARHVVENVEPSELRVRFLAKGRRPVVRRVRHIDALPDLDIVILRLCADVPVNRRKYTFMEPPKLAREWSASGFPLDGGLLPDFISGKFIAASAVAATGMLHLQCAQANDKVLVGFSGGPVMVEPTEGLSAVGVITACPTHPDGSQRAYGGVVIATPVSAVRDTRPELGHFFRGVTTLPSSARLPRHPDLLEISNEGDTLVIRFTPAGFGRPKSIDLLNSVDERLSAKLKPVVSCIPQIREMARNR